MSMPPHILHPDEKGSYEYFKALSDVVAIPIIIQNYIGPVGTPMSASLLARMCRDIGKRIIYLPWRCIKNIRRGMGDVVFVAGVLTGAFQWLSTRRHA